jgi:hypothetical protein
MENAPTPIIEKDFLEAADSDTVLKVDFKRGVICRTALRGGRRRSVKTTACRHTGADPNEARTTGAPRTPS